MVGDRQYEHKTVWAEDFDPFGETWPALHISVQTEIVRDGTGRMVARRGDRYWPSLVNIEVLAEHDSDCVKPWPSGLPPYLAQELGALLTQAADLAEALDKPDCDACGHWWPCEMCRTQAAEP